MIGIVKDTTYHIFVKGENAINLITHCFLPLSPNYYLLLQLWIGLVLFP